MHPNDAEFAEVDACLARMVSAWNAGDAAAFADEYTTDASYVIFAGIVSLGREEIRRSHVPVLERWQKGTRMSMRVLDRRVVGETVVMVTEGGIGKAARIRLDKVQTFVFVRENEVWRCAAFQNTKKNSLFIRVNERAMRRVRST